MGSGVVGTVSGVVTSSSTIEEVTSGVEVDSDGVVLQPERISMSISRLMRILLIIFLFMIYLPFLIKLGSNIFTSTQYNNT